MTRRFLPVIATCVAALLVAGCSGRAPQPAAAAPTVTVTRTIAPTPKTTPMPVASRTSATPTPAVFSSAPAPVPAHTPQGSVALTEWHDGDATNATSANVSRSRGQQAERGLQCRTC